MKKPICYIQKTDTGKYLSDFCLSAKFGAEENNIQVVDFIDQNEIPLEKTSIIVGSVEQSKEWLKRLGRPIPNQISVYLFKDFLKRTLHEPCSFSSIKKFPIFIKPFTTIKEFDTILAYSEQELYAEIDRQQLDKNLIVQCQDVVDFVSEYRLFVHNQRMIGISHYVGDFLKFPDRKFIETCFLQVRDKIKSKSYTIDFGVLSTSSTALIEINDGWAVGSYGLSPSKYYFFVRDRWFQLTGLYN